MKKILNHQVLFALILAAAPLAATAQTTFFSDNFSNGSTTNGTSIAGGTATASYTSYDIASTKNTYAGTNGVTIAPNDLHLALAASTSSGFLEAQALFVPNSEGAANAIPLYQIGDYIDITVVFTNTDGSLFLGTGGPIWIGLFNSGGNYPLAGGLAQSGLSTSAGSPYATGNCADWQGYVAQMTDGGGTTRITTRPIQNGALTDSADQELLGNNIGGGAFDNPAATTIETGTAPTFTLTNGDPYTVELRITLNSLSSLMISNFIYAGAGTTGPVLLSQGSATGITNGTFLTSAFDSFAIGIDNKTATYDPVMDISSILITGHSTAVTGPPTILSQPVSVTVATNGACAFSITANGLGMSYRWYRNGTNLLDQGNISGSTSSLLVVSPAGTNDVVSSANGYYVTVTGAGGYNTNSVTNSLTLVAATNLVWSGNYAAWDLNNTAAWQPSDSITTPLKFNYGDPVTFDDTGAGGGVTLTGNYLSAASVTVDTVNSSYVYTFQGSGSFAGPGTLTFSGSGGLTINNINTYSGGTIISNASGLMWIENNGGLGSGPVTITDNSGGSHMEIATAGSASSGISGDMVVDDNYTIQYDGSGSYAGVFLGNLSGTPGATLTLVPNPINTSTNDRIRVYGENTTYAANLNLNSPLITFAPYSGSGSQTYNGVISGSGSIIQKGTITFFNGANTYSGGMNLAAGAIGLGIDSTGSAGSPTSGPIGTGPLFLTIDSTTGTSGSAQVLASGGAITIGNPIQYPSGTNNLTLIVGGSQNLTFTGPFTLSGNDNITTNTYMTRTVQVTNTAATTFSGVISDQTNGVSAGYGLTITGNGTNVTGPLVLNNTETYTGPTTVSGGTLQVNGALNAASAVTVNSNATLSGTGAINGTVAVNAGGILAPGGASIGTLTINNNLTNAGNINVRVNNGGGQEADEIVVSGVLTNSGAGTVTVVNLGTALLAGNTFTLFNKALTNGAALTVTGAGVTWANNLAVNGTITVQSVNVVPTITPHITTFSLAATNVVINATNGVTGGTYYLLDSTNVATPLGQWTPVATNVVLTSGANNTFTFTGTNAASSGAVQRFYILSNTNN